MDACFDFTYGNEKKVPASEKDLLKCFKQLGIAFELLRHPPMHTVKESCKIRGDWAGGHCKCLFLRDKKNQHLLAVVLEDRRTDLAALAAALDFGRLSFGSPERLKRILGITPGAVTPFALINCQDRPDLNLTLVMDEKMLDQTPLHYHPLHNEATVRISPVDLLLFVREMGFEPKIIDFNTLSA